jgi:flagellar basal body-associated protein FliL
MSAINRQPNKKSGKNSTLIISGVIAIVAGLLFAYLMFYTAPEENIELVKIIAITEEGCIAETLDGFSVNIGDCNAQPGQYVDALVDQKVKDRAAAMNPTS